MKLLNNLLKKAEGTEQKYIAALEKKEESLQQLQTELAKKEFMLSDMRKAKLLDQITEESFTHESEAVETLRKQVQEAKKEVALIEEYKTADLQEVLDEADLNRKKLTQSKQKELEAIRKELIEAKKEYFNKMLEASDKYRNLVAPERKLDALKIQLGLKNQSYIADTNDALSMASLSTGSVIPLTVSNEEVYNALSYKRTPDNVKRYLAGN